MTSRQRTWSSAMAAWAPLLLLCFAALCSLPSSASAAGDTVVAKVYSSEFRSPPIARNYIGFSLEHDMAWTWTGLDHVRPSFVELMGWLSRAEGERGLGPLFRIGGNSADYSLYNTPTLPNATSGFPVSTPRTDSHPLPMLTSRPPPHPPPPSPLSPPPLCAILPSTRGVSTTRRSMRCARACRVWEVSWCSASTSAMAATRRTPSSTRAQSSASSDGTIRCSRDWRWATRSAALTRTRHAHSPLWMRRSRASLPAWRCAPGSRTFTTCQNASGTGRAALLLHPLTSSPFTALSPFPLRSSLSLTCLLSPCAMLQQRQPQQVVHACGVLRRVRVVRRAAEEGHPLAAAALVPGRHVLLHRVVVPDHRRLHQALHRRAVGLRCPPLSAGTPSHLSLYAALSSPLTPPPLLVLVV